MMPIYRTTLDVSIVPFDVINSDLDDHDTRFPEASNGLSTATLGSRRDLEDWAQPYRDVIRSIANKFVPYSVDESYEEMVKSNWVNRMYESGYARYHTHVPCDIALVWYLNSPSGCGNFVLDFNGTEYVVPIKTGDLIAFPARLGHYTEPNHSGQARLVMGANVVSTENFRHRMKGKLSDEQVDTIYSNRQDKITQEMIEWHEKNSTHLSE